MNSESMLFISCFEILIMAGLDYFGHLNFTTVVITITVFLFIHYWAMP